MMTDDYLLDSIESQQMNPRTIGRSGSFVEEDMGYCNKASNSSFQLSTAPTLKDKD